jgi:hypothetical protein
MFGMLAILLCLCLWQGPSAKQNAVSRQNEGYGGDKQQTPPVAALPAQNGVACVIQGNQPKQYQQDSSPWREPIVIVTGAYTVVSFLMLIAIFRQSASIKKQIDIQRESLRPRLSISSFSSMGSRGDPWTLAMEGRFVTFHAGFHNSGGIPAYRVIPESWIEFSYIPLGFTAEAVYHRGGELTVHPGNTETRYMIPLNRALTPTEIQACRDQRGTVCIRIKLTYTAWGKEVFTEEAYSMEPRAMMTITGSAQAN